MRILFVLNNFFVKGNGLSASAQRNVAYLRELGHEVRILSGIDPFSEERPEYPLEHFAVPVFEDLINKQGYSFAKVQRSVIAEAVKWADIIHLDEPFHLERVVSKMARRYGKVCVGTYHLHPENLFCSVHMGRSLLLNHICMRLWEYGVFNRCAIVHCPTENVKARLERWGFKPEMRVITNGMVPKDIGPDSPICESGDPDTITIVTTGRYSVEKDQLTLLRAMKYCRHSRQIRLVLLGRGPMERKLKLKAFQLMERNIVAYPVQFGFHSIVELQNIYRHCDIYVHCATVEVEGLSCMEAIQMGMVPIIATGRLTATAQYAKSDRSRFPARNAKALAKLIDYWFEHPEERRAESRKYLGSASEYDIGKSIVQLQRLYYDAIREKR